MVSLTMRLATEGSTPSSSAMPPTVISRSGSCVASASRTWLRTSVRLRSFAEIGFPTSSSEVRRSLENAGPTASSSSSAVIGASAGSVLAPGAETDPLASHSLRVERALAGARFTVTLLRPDAFATNALGWAYPIGRDLPVRLAHPEATLAPIHPADIADIAVRALTGDGGSLAGRALTLTGPEQLTFREQLAAVSDAIGRAVPVEPITRERAAEEMGAHMPAAMAGSLLDLWAAATVTPVAVADTTETLLGAPARTFRQWARENAHAFRAPGR